MKTAVSKWRVGNKAWRHRNLELTAMQMESVKLQHGKCWKKVVP